MDNGNQKPYNIQSTLDSEKLMLYSKKTAFVNGTTIMDNFYPTLEN